MKMKTYQKVLLYVTLALVSFVVIFPVLWAVSASLRSDQELYAYMSPATWHTFFPVEVTIEAYLKLFRDYGFLYRMYSNCGSRMCREQCCRLCVCEF